ncbi:phenylalanine--tRNA ligase subunit beta [Cesiribacter sp. SM1]|uniref:phenylalanine--tRNA ligase subunit beta n=1 Tax=Cesiribacter sp. SM1 TaxID=2861196 RepID=UPI001CD2E442|nr:phenylalanine--tRNA ligase subunit beta [Cesiribacter sp. SM1]
MKISYNWLRQYIDIQESPEEIARLLTSSGLEVESVEKQEGLPGGLEGIVIGEVLTREQHPNADRLSLTTVDIGSGGVVPIVCGAANVAAGQKVVVATVGATLYPTGGEPFQIKKAKIRGEASEGMICAEDEIGLGTSHAGIMVLDTQLPNGTPAAQYFNLKDDYLFEIGLTPNRSDAASHIGVARDLKALLNRPVQWPDVSGFTVDNHKRNIEVEVQNPEACPRYSGLTISGVKVQESPDWLKERLQSIGLEPINNVVDVTNFVLHELGQPLHAFDADKIRGGKVVVRYLAAGTVFRTLDQKDRKLQEQDLMICDAEGGMCIGGVFGGMESGISEGTQSVFLESAYFSPDWIRRTAQYHALKTDASFRFERGTDPNITVYALKRAAQLIKEVAGGEISSDIADFYPQPVENFSIKVRWQKLYELIGHHIPEEEVKKILNNLDIQLQDETAESFTAIVPPYRVDVQRPADIVEEVLRIYGLDNIPMPAGLSSSYMAEFPKTDENILRQEASALLAANGYLEIMTNSLTNPEYARKSDFLEEEKSVEILNKLSEDLGVMRQTLLFSGLEVIAHNINHRQRDLKLFEFGKTYRKEDNKYQEHKYVGMWITGLAEGEHYLQEARPVAYHDLRLSIELLLNRFGINDTYPQVIHEREFAYGLEIVYNGRKIDRAFAKQPIVRLGKVKPALAALAGVKQEVFWAEVNWALLLQLSGIQETVYQPVSRFPEVRRDLSLVLDKGATFNQIQEITRKAESTLIKRISVFDVYEGDKIEAGKKAYALSFILQDEDKTLTDKVIDKTMQRLMAAFEKELGAYIRK